MGKVAGIGLVGQVEVLGLGRVVVHAMAGDEQHQGVPGLGLRQGLPGRLHCAAGRRPVHE